MRTANDIVRFCLELAALTSFGLYAWHATPGVARWFAVVAAPLAAAALWGWLIAPNSASRLPDPNRLLLEVAFFTAACLALAAARRPAPAIGMALLIAVNLPLDRLLPQ
jgi:hypothetical protein